MATGAKRINVEDIEGLDAYVSKRACNAQEEINLEIETLREQIHVLRPETLVIKEEITKSDRRYQALIEEIEALYHHATIID